MIFVGLTDTQNGGKIQERIIDSFLNNSKFKHHGQTRKGFSVLATMTRDVFGGVKVNLSNLRTL